MLAILIYIVAAVAVVCIGLVAVGRETFIAATTLAHVTYDVGQATEWITVQLDEHTAGRLTPADLEWILATDAERLATTSIDPDAPGAQVLDDRAAVNAVFARLEPEQTRMISRGDIAAVIALRTRFLQNIGAIGAPADDPVDPIGDGDGPPG